MLSLKFFVFKFTLAQEFVITNSYSINPCDLKILKVSYYSINIIEPLCEVKNIFWVLLLSKKNFYTLIKKHKGLS